MIILKDLIDELGGLRSVGLGALLLVFLYVAANRYFESIETRLSGLDTSVKQLEAKQQRDDAIHDNGGRFTAERGESLEARISRIERIQDGQ